MTLPPRVLECELLPPQETRQQFAVDAADPSLGWQASPAPAVTPRMVGLEDEIL
jgi:hypothetical protein